MINEKQFQDWYAQKAERYKLNPDPDDPRHFYDYRAAFAAGATPDETGHWPSKFKLPGHPREVVGGVNTRTDERVTSSSQMGTIQADTRSTFQKTLDWFSEKWITPGPLGTATPQQAVAGAMKGPYIVLAGVIGSKTLGLADVPVSHFAKKYAEHELRDKITSKGIEIHDVSSLGEPLWRLSDTHGNSKFINPDNVTEGTYSRDLGEVLVRATGGNVTPEMQTVYNVAKFIGTLKPTHKVITSATKGIPARPWLLRIAQTGWTGMATDSLLQIEDIISEKRDSFSFKEAMQTGGWFTLFGGVIEGARAAKIAIADAHVINKFFKDNPTALKHISPSELKLLASSARAVQDGMPYKAWIKRYGGKRELELITWKLGEYINKLKWKPTVPKLLPEKAGLSTSLGLKGADPSSTVAIAVDKAYRAGDVNKLKTISKAIRGTKHDRLITMLGGVDKTSDQIDHIVHIMEGGTITPSFRESLTKRNPYLTMPLERVKEDAEYGVALAKEALARTDPEEALGKSTITPATYTQKKKAHALKDKYNLTDEQYQRALRYATGQDSMATMNVDEARDAIEQIDNLEGMVEMVEEIATVPFVNIDPRLPKGYSTEIRKAAKSDEVFNKTIGYSNAAGGVPSNPDVPNLDWRQERYAQDLVNIARVQKRAGRKGVKKEEVGRQFNLVNPWSSARYALAQSGVKSGIPLRRMFSDIVAKEAGVRIQNAKNLDKRLINADASKIGSPLTFQEGVQASNWLFTNPETDPETKTRLWHAMSPQVQKIATEVHEFLQNESALQVRWARWIKWDRAAKRADRLIQRLRDKGKKLTKTRLKTIMKPVKLARPPDAPMTALQEGRYAEDAGQLLDYLSTQTWGTRKFYYMTERELKDLTSLYPTGTIPEELEEAAALVGAAPEQVLPETMTREGKGKIAKGGSLLSAVVNHANRVGTFAATYDDLQRFWEAFASTNPSPRDISRVRMLVNTSLGFRHAVEPWVKIARGLNVWFWRPYFAFSPKRAAWFSYRNLHQNVAYGLSQTLVKEAAKSGAVLSKAVGKAAVGGVWSDTIDKVNPWIREDYDKHWDSRISQRRQMYLQFILQKQGSIVSDFGNKATAIIDVLGSAPIYSDEVNRLQAWPLMHQTAYRNVQQLVQGKISAKKFWSNLDMDTLHVDQRIEMHRLMDEGKWRDLVNNFAEYKTENIHFRYETALRSVAEQTPGGRAVVGLATFPRGTFEIMYQNGLKPFVQGFESGNYKQSYKGLRTMIMGIFGSRMARWMLYAVTGKVAYGIFDTVFRYTPVAPGPRRIQELFDTVNEVLWRAQEQDLDVPKTADIIMAAVAYQAELFIPFCDVAIDYYEASNDVHGVRLYSLLKKKAMKHFRDETGKAFRPANRDTLEKIHHTFWGGAEKGKEMEVRERPTRQERKRRSK